ncbi:aminotransferase-like domain-containing protein [Crossiella cryophila]|uniref:DNA-binding transcriptional MocR family regulator n=1 Tax=Crossiella cryophila TaxID=43355 RepID=A0A7W7CB53_9PSEU|nr:PLP-dependent aminotransferase family protein [Crossiella cryophila]MBB4677922.1 DNA-binding transcriptional MocR family regulator [Crossiella cryophila]
MSESSTVDWLADRLRIEIAGLAPGDRLPTSRELVRRLGVSPVSVSRAVALLAAEGAVVTRPGTGTFVAPRRAAPVRGDTSWQTVVLPSRPADPLTATDLLSAPPDGTITMAGGYLHPSLQPTRALSAALTRAARRPDAWDRAPSSGLAPLRTLFARMAGGDLGPEDVLITGGGQGALAMAFRALAVPFSPVLVESPTYQGALAAARAAGLTPVPVPLDADGIRPDLLAEALRTTGARLIYLQPGCHNPTGAVLSPERRRQVMELARASRAFVIEDDYARHLGHGTPPPPPLVADDPDGTVVYLTSLTKPTAPSLRVGALIARGPALARLRATRLVDDFFLARPLQEAALDLLSNPAWDRHRRTLAAALKDRCATLATALARETPQWTVRAPVSGLHLWLRLDTEETGIVRAARAQGVTVVSGRGHFPAEPPAPHLRLSFAAAADLAELTEAARVLGRVAQD